MKLAKLPSLFIRYLRAADWASAGDGRKAVSLNGRHFGVQVGNTVYNLLHPNGIPIDSWANAYQSYGNIVLVPK